jgi:hypothetical protein
VPRALKKQKKMALIRNVRNGAEKGENRKIQKKK